MPCSIEELPIEAVAAILRFLDVYDLVAVSRLNRFFHDIVKDFPYLQYHFARELYDMRDVNTGCAMDIRKKVAEIERRERAWRAMDLSNKTCVKVRHQTSHIYDLSGGVYLLGDCKRYLQSRNTITLRHLDLAKCSQKKSVAEDWPELTVESDIVDMGLSLPEFDLIAIVGLIKMSAGSEKTVVISLRELSTGKNHPLAKVPDIPVGRASGGQGKLSIMLEVVGPRLVLLLTWNPQSASLTTGDRNVLYCINWWDGYIVTAERSAALKWDGFVFLSEDTILLPCRAGRLEIVRLPKLPMTVPAHSFERIAAFMLPETQSVCTLGIIQCRAEPNPSGAPHPTLNTEHAEFAERLRSRKRPPVAPDPAKALVLLQLYYREFNTEADAQMGLWGVLRHNVSLAVRRCSLLDLVREAIEKKLFVSPDMLAGMGMTAVEPGLPLIPWTFWGPHARWHANDVHVSNWITVTAGQKYIGTHESGRIVIKDYNPITVKRAKAWLRAKRDSATAVEPAHEAEAVSEGSGSIDGITEDSNEDETLDMEIGRPRKTIESVRGLRESSIEEESDTPSSADQDVPAQSVSTSLSLVADEEGGQMPPDRSWDNVRVIEGYNEEEETELDRLFLETTAPIPCVEYHSKEIMDYHGYLMDEERIIGLRYEEHGTIGSFDVFTL